MPLANPLSRPNLTVSVKPPSRSLSDPIAFVLLTFGVSWSMWIGAWLLSGRPTSINNTAMVAAIFAGSFAPGLVAAILSAREGPETFKAWLRGFVQFRCGWRAYAVALLPLPLVFLALTVLLGYTPRLDRADAMPGVFFYLTLFPISIFNGLATVLMGAGPLGEEGGWRGYLLPRLLDQMGEVRAAIIIGVIWSLWHLPIMALFPEWRGGASFGLFLLIYLVGVTALSYIAAVVWRLGRGSLVPCIWLHGLVNAIGGLAFDHRAWANPWSLGASAAHSSLAFVVVALALAALWTRSSKRPLLSRAGVATERNYLREARS